MENPNTPTPSGMTPGAASAGSGQTAAPSPIRLIYGSLACVQTSDLILELQRRQSGRGDFAGDIEPCLVLAVTPSDLSEYWESDDAGSTHPGSATPTPEEWPALVKAFERWQDTGGFTEVMQVCRDAWNTAKEDTSK